MASPQAENGHTDIAHEVLEKLMLAKLNGTQMCLVLAVIRKTWGWNKKQEYISLTEFQQLTDRHRNLIARELSVLQNRNILQQTQSPTPGRAAQWKFNKDWESWVSPNRVSPNTVTVTQEGVPLQGAKGVTQSVNLQKKKKRKKNKASSDASTDPRWSPIIELFLSHYERINGRALVTNDSDFKALKDLLTKTQHKSGYGTDALQQAARNFLESKDEFHTKQGHPLRFWANNICAFMPKQGGQRETPEYLN